MLLWAPFLFTRRGVAAGPAMELSRVHRARVGRKTHRAIEKLVRLDYLVGGEERSVFPALLTPGSVDGGYLSHRQR